MFVGDVLCCDGSVNSRCVLTDLAPFHFYLGLPVIWAQAVPSVIVYYTHSEYTNVQINTTCTSDVQENYEENHLRIYAYTNYRKID